MDPTELASAVSVKQRRPAVNAAISSTETEVRTCGYGDDILLLDEREIVELNQSAFGQSLFCKLPTL